MVIDPTLRPIETSRGRQVIHDFGGPAEAPLLHFAHANGFNGYTYRRILSPLVGRFRVIAWDARGHGHSPLPADANKLSAWTTYRDDLMALVAALDEPVLLAGHSLGAAASVMAGGMMPERVSGLLLAEPVIPLVSLTVAVSLARAFNLTDLNPLARAALRRRRDFPDRASATAAYIGRGAFKTWPEEMIADYVAGGFLDSPSGVTLACTPEWEAATFSSLPSSIAYSLSRIRAPIIALLGERNSTAPLASMIQVQLAAPHMSAHRVAETTHFLPMERPDLIARAALALADGVRLTIE